jgi:hypothetical protein
MLLSLPDCSKVSHGFEPCLNRVEKVDGWVTEKTLTESQGLYIHQFAPALYLDAYAISNFVQDLLNPPPHD